MQDNIFSFFLMTTRGRTYVITRTKTATPTFKIFKITPTILLKHQLLSHYFMSEGDLAPKARFQSASYKDQGEDRVWQQWQKAQRESRGHPAAQASNPKVGHSPNFAQHCPHSTFLKIRFLRLTFFHSLVATEVHSLRHYRYPIPGAMLSTQARGKGDRLSEKATLATEEGVFREVFLVMSAFLCFSYSKSQIKTPDTPQWEDMWIEKPILHPFLHPLLPHHAWAYPARETPMVGIHLGQA